MTAFQYTLAELRARLEEEQITRNESARNFDDSHKGTAD